MKVRMVGLILVVIALLQAATVYGVELSMDGYPAFPPEAELKRMAELYKTVRAHENERNYEAAALAMEELVGSSWPFELDVLSFKLGLARAYQRAQMGEKAESLLVSLESSTTSKHPLFPEIYFQLSTAILYGSDRQRGLERLEYLAQRFSESDAGQRALLILARAHRDDRDALKAWSFYDRYLMTYLGRKERHTVMLEATDMFFENQLPDRAEQTGRQVWSEVHRFPESGKIAIRLIRTFRKFERTSAARNIAEDLCRSDTPEAQEGCLLLAQIFEAEGDDSNAIEAWRRTLEMTPMTRLNVRAFMALGKLEQDVQRLPVLPDWILQDRENPHWSSMMTEAARLAAGRGLHLEVIHALQDVPNADDRASAQRSRLFLNAARALSDYDEAQSCEWLSRAVAVRPVTTDHRAVVRHWATVCREKNRSAFRETLIAMAKSDDTSERELFMDAVRAVSGANDNQLVYDVLNLPIDFGVENAESRARMLVKAAVALGNEQEHRQCHWLQTAVKVRPFVVEHKAVVRSWLNACAPEPSEAHVALFDDVASDAGVYAVEVMGELIGGWGTNHRSLQQALVALWDAPISSRDRLALTPHVLRIQLSKKASRWPDDLLLIESAVWNELASGFPQSLYVSIFDLLDEHGKPDQAIDWLFSFAEHARGPGQARVRKALSHVFDQKERERYDALSEWYAHWYPDAKDLPEIAARQVELRAVGADLSDAWLCTEKWLARFDKPDALRFIKRVQAFFMNRGSQYVEAINAYILASADSDEEAFTAHQQLGDYYLKMMDYEKAALHMEQAFGLSMAMSDKDKMKVGTGLLKAVVEAGYPEKYVRYLLAGIERIMGSMENPALKAQTGHQLAKALERLGLLDEAHRMYREVADLDINNMSAKAALYNLAKSYANAGDDQNALATYMEYLKKYDGESDQRFYNIALANALSVAMKSADPEVVGELQMKVEAMINGVTNPYISLDLAQYFGRQGHQQIQEMLLARAVDDAKSAISNETSPDAKYKLLDQAVKRLFKMGYNDEAVSLGYQYYNTAVGSDTTQQTEALYESQYERLRAMLGQRINSVNVMESEAIRLLEKTKELKYKNAEAKLLHFLSFSANGQSRWAYKRELVENHSDSSFALVAKVDLAGKAYLDGDKTKALTLAQDALAQSSGEYYKNYEDKFRFNAIYITAVLLDEAGKKEEASALWREIDGYVYKDNGLYVKEYMNGSKLY